MEIRLGDVIEMRKPHPCGANRWTVVRTGIDIRIRCAECGRTVLMPRTQFIRAMRKRLAAGTPGSEEGDDGPRSA